MIAFNGRQYLPAASHGNMRITAACLGGQWVIGGKWLTHATQQAIIAAFGAVEGIAVILETNDYLNQIATTDPQRALQISGFINEYPMLVASLVETSKVATMNAQTSDKAVFVTDIIADNASDELLMNYYLVNDSSGTTWGSTQGWQSNTDAFIVALYASNGNFWYHNAGGYRNTGVSRKSQVGKWLTQYITKSKCGLVGIDESNLGNGAIGTFTGDYPVKLELQYNVQMKEAIMKRNGTDLIHLVPAADNVMVDIARCIVIHNTGNGIATIAITDKQ